MTYKVAFPKNKEIFAQKADSGDSLFLYKITGNSGNRAPIADPTEGTIVAVKLASTVLDADIWLAFKEDFKPDDEQAVFYADELPLLVTKDANQLREIHRDKLTFGPGSRVRR